MRVRRSFLRGFAAVIVLAGLGAGGWLWLRDSSLVEVTAVRVSGATTIMIGAIGRSRSDAPSGL